MALRIRFQYPTGSSLGYSIERLSDGTFYDFSTGNFAATPRTMFAGLPEDSGGYLGRYKLTLTPTPIAQFINGDYAISIQDQVALKIVAQLGATMYLGDDSTAIPYFPSAPTVLNYGFETPPLAAGSFQYTPSGTAWTFIGGGITSNNSSFSQGASPAPEGTQVGFIQDTSAISQTVNDWNSGSYAIVFQAAQRVGSSQDFTVSVDGNVVGTFKPSGTSYASYSTVPFSVLAGNHSISFVGLNSARGDNTCFIDEIQVVCR